MTTIFKLFYVEVTKTGTNILQLGWDSLIVSFHLFCMNYKIMNCDLFNCFKQIDLNNLMAMGN